MSTEVREKRVADEVAQISMPLPHVVLLGAGASRAAFPKGDRHGRRLPVMADFSDIVPVAKLLESAGFTGRGVNFEDAYSRIAANPEKAELRRALEASVLKYFSALALPDAPTLYDHLVVSLRPKDIIATFNWDPFLILAARRHAYLGEMPYLAFLHGNVMHGFCARDGISGIRGARCSICHELFVPDRLLFPVAEKDYDKDPSIGNAWARARHGFQHAFMVTIFGYGAPASDQSAVRLLKEAWGDPKDRSLEQIEIIDVRPEADLRESWRPFIHTHHYEVHADFYASWIAKHPRRTGEAYQNQYHDAYFIEDNPIPRNASLPDLQRWLEPLRAAERHAEPKDERAGKPADC
jgi:hypothetical protein